MTAGKVSFLQRLTKGPLFSSGLLPKTRAAAAAREAALAATRMCFVAGTLVATQFGAMAVENVQPGMQVPSRDPATGAVALRPVVATFVTHPEELFHIAVDADADGTADETHSGTGEHPFYVVTRENFVPARELTVGDILRSLNGQSATVAGISRERAPPGQTFTTYNFEVAQFHT